MLCRVLKAELIKGRRAPVWLAFVVLPLIPAVLGTANYRANIGILDDWWLSLWTQHTLFSAYFFLPALLGVYCAWEWRLEHSDRNFNSYLTMPVSRTTLYLAKLLPAVGVSIFTQALVGVYFVVSGKFVGMTAAVPWAQLADWLLCGALGSIAICAVQLFLSLWLRSFAVPVALALVGGIIGLLFTSQGWGIYFPYALLSLGMRANNPNLVLELPQFILSAVLYTLLFAALTIRLLKKRDVSGE